MTRTLATLLLLAAAAPAAARAQTAPPLPAGVEFRQNPNLPPGGEIAILIGTPGAPGVYAFRVRFAPGLKVMPHSHPDDRLYTVLQGEWSIGIGDQYDPAKLQWFGPGSVYVLPANTVHFHGADRGVTIFQVSGIGPTATTYARPEDDPRRN